MPSSDNDSFSLASALRFFQKLLSISVEVVLDRTALKGLYEWSIIDMLHESTVRV